MRREDNSSPKNLSPTANRECNMLTRVPVYHAKNINSPVESIPNPLCGPHVEAAGPHTRLCKAVFRPFHPFVAQGKKEDMQSRIKISLCSPSDSHCHLEGICNGKRGGLLTFRVHCITVC
ncbi:hypothetical protein CDAR_608111 [Caerostris darwini]|uniref:Uncharacterized protein n=1 Tax=Caerostris darwini TaxID=1538125 RepID=A0AAV4PZG4_9ARAC|nr:hypothetical protein CDAR_608111 [Caerostris darwini]